ncbi:hypothetical protein [Streptomyces sp. NPDC058739]|uniref:hypothetical protein n=1 Tax=Streptomyces sp. NPDC058739 TaxID=3346618 RepID=UPI0036A12BCE
MHGAEAYSRGLVAELVDSGSEPLGMQAGGLAQGVVLVDALAPVSHDQGDQGASAGDHSEGQLRQVEECPGADAVLGLQSFGAEQLPPGIEHHGGCDDRRGEGQEQDPADRPQSQALRLIPSTPG